MENFRVGQKKKNTRIGIIWQDSLSYILISTLFLLKMVVFIRIILSSRNAEVSLPVLGKTLVMILKRIWRGREEDWLILVWRSRILWLRWVRWLSSKCLMRFWSNPRKIFRMLKSIYIVIKREIKIIEKY